VDGRGGAVATRYPASGLVYTIVGPDADLAVLGSPQRNTRYTIRLTTGIASTSGDFLPETVETYFTGPYVPLYGGVIGVRAHLGGFIHNTTDDEINFHLWRASIATNELIFTRNRLLRDRVTLEQLIDYVPSIDTWGMLQYAEIVAAITLLESYYADVLDEAGRRSGLATFEYEVSVQLLEEIRARIKELERKRDEIAATFLLDATVPKTTIKSRYWHPDNYGLARDDSYSPRSQFGEHRPNSIKDPRKRWGRLLDPKRDRGDSW
jgi:hypothetical protein